MDDGYKFIEALDNNAKLMASAVKKYMMKIKILVLIYWIPSQDGLKKHTEMIFL